MDEPLYILYARDAFALHRDAMQLKREGKLEAASLKRRAARSHMDWAWQAKDTLPVHVSLRRAA